MFYPHFILFTCVNFIIFTRGFSDVQPQEMHSDTRNPSDTSQISEESIECERRQEIADKYLDTLQNAKEEWIDPYDMIGLSMKQLKEQLEVKTSVKGASSNPTISNKPASSNKKDTTAHSDNSKTKASYVPVSSNSETLNVPKEQKGSCALDSIYVTRWVKKLLYRIERESDKESSAISFSLDSTIMESLKEMANAKLFEVSSFDDIISNLLAQAVITRKESFTWSRTYVYYSDTIWLIIYALSICAIVYILHRSFVCRPKFTFLCCSIVISVFWHWMHLYQQKKALKHAELASMQIPTQCKKHDLGLFEHINEYIKSFFATSDCSKYYEALLIDPFWEVSLSVAVSETITAFLFQPLSASSRALNYFIKQLFDGLPIHLTVALIAFIFILAIMMCNYSFSIPWISRIEPQHAITGSRVQEVQQPTSRQILTEAIHNAASTIRNAPVEAILAEDSTSLSVDQRPSKSIQYKSSDGAKRKKPPKDSRSTVPKVIEDELTIQSGYFDARKSAQPRYSDPEVNVNVKKAALPTEKSLKRLSIEDHSKVDPMYNANLMDTTRVASSSNPVQLHSNNSGRNLGGNDEPEISNLPESLSDSFEVLPIPSDDDNNESCYCNKSHSGSNMDTSLDILQQMHASCKFCN